jgi:hypothetical protein
MGITKIFKLFLMEQVCQKIDHSKLIILTQEDLTDFTLSQLTLLVMAQLVRLQVSTLAQIRFKFKLQC